MTPKIKTRRSFTILGVATRVTRGSESAELFGRIWQTFESRLGEIDAMAADKGYFGVNFPTGDEQVTEYVAGMMVASGTTAPEGLKVREVLGGDYAVFECAVTAIGATYQHAFTVWLPTAAVRLDAGRAPFEEYQGNAPEQPVRLHIPVRP